MKNSSLNFSDQCLKYWNSSDFLSPCETTISDVYSEIAGYLSSAPKFEIPVGGIIIQDTDSIAVMLESLKLKHPCVVLEFKPALSEIFENQMITSKRIAVVWDLEQVLPMFVRKSFFYGIHRLQDILQKKRNSLLVQAVAYFDDYNRWACVLGSIEIPLIKAEKTNNNIIELLDKYRLHGIMYKNKLNYKIETIVHLHDYINIKSNDVETSARSVFYDTANEIHAALGFAAVSSRSINRT